MLKMIHKNLDDIKVEYKDRNQYTVEELEKIKRNKELRDLFYNRIRERKNYLHKMFTRFYYKGLMFYMKNKNAPPPSQNTDNAKIETNTNNNNNTDSNANNNPINEIPKKEEQINTNTNTDNNTNNDNTNITNNTNTINTNNEEKPKEEAPKPESRYAKARGLRRLLNKRGKEKIEILRKYFNKFHQAGILVALRKGTKRASLLRQVEGVDLETAFNAVTTSQAMNEIEVDENSNVQDFKEALDKKMEDKKFAEEMEQRKIEEEKKRKEEEERKNEEYKQKLKKLETIIYKIDRKKRMIKKKYFEIYNLKTKVLSLGVYDKPRRTKTKKIRKRKTIVMSVDSILKSAEMNESGNKNGPSEFKRSNSNEIFDKIKEVDETEIDLNKGEE